MEAHPHGFVTVKCELGDVEATGLEVGNGFIDDGLVFDPIMERAVGRIGGGG